MPKSDPEIFLSAGEVSGDLLASELVQQLRTKGSYHFTGVTGEHMRQNGVDTVLPQEQFRVMGLWQVLTKAQSISRAEQELSIYLFQHRPSLVILIDFPGLHFRIAKTCKDLGIPVFQYVCPKVWAWGKRRIQKLEVDFDKILGVLPFEEEFFRTTKVPYTFVGSPHLQRVTKKTQLSNSLKTNSQTLTVLLGSRRDEIQRMLPIAQNIIRDLLIKTPTLRILIPVAATNFTDMIALAFKENSQVHILNGQSLEAMAASQAAFVNSGTATLECALVGTPMVVCYRMDALSYHIASRLIQVKWASLVNLILQQSVVPEYIQNFQTTHITEALHNLLQPNSITAHDQKEHFNNLRHVVAPPQSQDAATIIQQFLSMPYARSNT